MRGFVQLQQQDYVLGSGKLVLILIPRRSSSLEVTELKHVYILRIRKSFASQ